MSNSLDPDQALDFDLDLALELAGLDVRTYVALRHKHVCLQLKGDKFRLTWEEKQAGLFYDDIEV